jgi:hypothetical protein
LEQAAARIASQPPRIAEALQEEIEELRAEIMKYEK